MKIFMPMKVFSESTFIGNYFPGNISHFPNYCLGNLGNKKNVFCTKKYLTKISEPWYNKNFGLGARQRPTDYTTETFFCQPLKVKKISANSQDFFKFGKYPLIFVSVLNRPFGSPFFLW